MARRTCSELPFAPTSHKYAIRTRRSSQAFLSPSHLVDSSMIFVTISASRHNPVSHIVAQRTTVLLGFSRSQPEASLIADWVSASFLAAPVSHRKHSQAKGFLHSESNQCRDLSS